MELANLINKNKILNIAVIIFILIIANYIYKIQNKTLESLKQKKDIEIKKNAVLVNISGLEKNIDYYKSLLNKKDITSIINAITTIAKDMDMSIISIKPKPERDYPAYIKYSFDLVIHAKDYHQVGKFISEIENSPDVYMVEDINIRPIMATQIQEQNYKISVELTLSTVFFKG